MRESQTRQTSTSTTQTTSGASESKGTSQVKSSLQGKGFDEQQQLLSPNTNLAKTIPVVCQGFTSKTDMTQETAHTRYNYDKDTLYEVPVSISALTRIGAANKFYPDWIKPLRKTEKPGDDVLEHDGGSIHEAGASSFTLSASAKHSDERVVTASNNGMLALFRSARAAFGGLTGLGVTAPTFAIPADKSFEALFSYRMNNDIDDADARNQNYYGGIAQNDLVNHANGTIESAAGAFMAAWKLAGRIDLTQITGQTYKPLDGDITKAGSTLNAQLTANWVDRDPDNPTTYVKGPIDVMQAFSDAVAAKATYNAKQTVNFDFPASVCTPFVKELVKQLQASLDLSFIPEGNDDFRKRFTESWQKAIEDAFVNAADRLEKRYKELQTPAIYAPTNHTDEQPLKKETKNVEGGSE